MRQLRTRACCGARAGAWCLAWLIGVAALQAAAHPARSDAQACGSEQGADEYTTKAAFLYKFTRYTKWPESAFRERDSPLRIAVFGKDPFGAALDEALRDKRIGAHPLLRLSFPTLSELGECHVLFVPGGSNSELQALRRHYKDQPVLIVGDSLESAEQGALIGLYLEQSRIRFAVNVESVRSSSLELSSELLKLAKRIEKPRAPGEGSR